MRVRLAVVLVLVLVIILVAAPALVSAVNRPAETLGVATFNSIESATILVAPNNASINLLVFTAGLPANGSYTLHVTRADTCAAPGVSLTGPLGPFFSNGLGYLNVAATPALSARVDLSGTQNIAVRVVNNAGNTVRCGNVFTTRPGGAGRHWW